MARFRTNQATFRALQDERHRRELERTLNEGVPQGQGMEALVLEATDRWDIDPNKTHCTYTRRDRIITSAKPVDPLRHFLAILSSDPEIDVASYDRILTSTDQFCEGWKIYDLAGRGRHWLNHFVIEHANGLSTSPTECAAIDYHAPDDFREFVRSTLQLQNIQPRAGTGYLYFQVHCPDRRALFAAINRYARTAPGADGKSADRTVFRSCCRGIGGQAIVLIAAEGEPADAPVLQTGLRELMRQDDISAVDSKANTPMPTSGPRLQALVTHTTIPPTVVGHSSSQVAFSVTFEARRNEPGILLRLCKAASSVAAADASVYYLGGHVKSGEHDGDQIASCAVGWAIERRSLAAFHAAVDSVIQPLCHGGRPPCYDPSV